MSSFAMSPWNPSDVHFHGAAFAGIAQDLTLTYLAANQRRIPESQMNGSNEKAAVQVVKASRPRTRRSRERALANTCLKALTSLASPKENFTKFNKVVDRLKANEDWKSILSKCVSVMETDDLVQLLNNFPSELLGYDREALHVVLVEAKVVLSKRIELTSEKLGEFQKLIDSFETLTLTVDESNMVLLGGGAVNKVFMIKYIDPLTGNQTEAVFKPDPADLDTLTKFKESKFGTAAASGIPSGIDAHLPSRAVASSKIDRLLFGDSPISVHTEYVTVNGRRGILMQKAKGRSPKPTGREVQEEISLNENQGLRRVILSETEAYGTVTKSTLCMIAVSNHYDRVIFEGNAGKFRLIGVRKQVARLDPVNPVTVAGLIRLQIKDFICGECDRHPENYFIDDNGCVTGIDEDCCFGVNAIPKGDVRSQPPIVIIPGIAEIPNNASLMLRMPPVVTKKMREQVQALIERPEELTYILKEHVSLDEGAATLDRLTKLMQHINSEKCLVVDTEDDLIADSSMKRYDSNNSLLIRELKIHRNKGEKGWNFLRAHRSY